MQRQRVGTREAEYTGRQIVSRRVEIASGERETRTREERAAIGRREKKWESKAATCIRERGGKINRTEAPVNPASQN